VSYAKNALIKKEMKAHMTPEELEQIKELAAQYYSDTLS
jgi:hypothetical protein